ncbi:MAG TPA: cold shock domain-containing protein [Planctomycetota bacterium]|jgi:CspA family cold shock protein|nr:cold shock domain-containing protein [Planctomycetota bacterium]OQC20270.1 MAG: Cold shock protein CspB [Planctomycetes bacterium ADurb.Bin069]HNR99952.1 cold shock domain-containing protein [Planctomycetota bacterium]HNU24818.1 cold shock domain-containing protein [Planctomycetota bacterium]HOE29420.1 cold shock domain-containing protein [Planctomycetota bacterium]
MQGRVKKLVADRGFGFLEVEGQKDVFFHRSAIVEGNFDTLRQGQSVTFEIEDSGRGPRASNIKVV